MKTYLFRGQKIKATSKDVILRRFGLKNNAKTLAMVTKIKKMVKIKVRRGLKVAIDYLTSFAPISLVPDELQKRAGLDIMVGTLAHSLRRAARDGKVAVEYKPDSRGVMIAHYTAIINDKPKGFDI